MKFPYIKIRQYSPKPYKPFGRGIIVKVDLSSYSTKADLKMQQELIHLNQLQNLIQLV